MTAFVDVQFIDGLALPYVVGAETALFAPDLNPAFGAAWNMLVTTFPGLTLQPLFDQQPVDELADILDAIRLRGEEPPDLFAWFTVPTDDAVVENVVAALQALPMVLFAGARPRTLPARLVSYGTNPDTNITLQIQPAPNGVDALYAWQVAGGTGEGMQVADVELGWNTNHEELLTARIHSPSGFIADEVPTGGHGTAVAGILVGADNGVGTIGIVPDADLTLVADRGMGTGDTPEAALLAAQFASAAAVSAAIKRVGVGGVVLIEEAVNFFARPPKPDGTPDERPDILLEFWPPVQAAIRAAALFDITVVEPAGNGNVNLDNFPFLAHTRPGARTFSHAIVVGAADLKQPKLDSWERTESSFGSRVDCFAAGSLVRAPSSDGSDEYLLFGGTSAASAIIAGTVAAVQSMAIEHKGEPLDAISMRRLFRDPDLATKIPSGNNGGIGAMPDLRKIARRQGWPRILPVGLAATTGDAAFMVHLDDDDRLVRRHWTFFADWGVPVPLLPPFNTFSVTACQPAVLSTVEQDPVARLVHEAYVVGPGGVHHLFFDSIGTFKDLAFSIAPLSSVAQGRSLAAVRAAIDRVVVAAVSPEGRLVVMTGDPDALAAQLTNPLVIDDVGSYRRMIGPAIVSRATAKAEVVAIEDAGALMWFTGTTVATIGTGWTKGPPEPSATEFDSGARPALLVVDDVLLAAAVGAEGWLRITTIDPAAHSIDTPVVVDVQVAIATLGPLALARAGNNVVVLAVDVDNQLRVATRAVAGGDWTSLGTVDSPRDVSPLGGVTAVSLSDVGVLAVVVARDGTLLSALSRDGVDWTRLRIIEAANPLFL